MLLPTDEFEQAIGHLKDELSKLRTGRASPALVEGVKVDYYGQPMEVRQLASISVPEARQLLIQPWDKNALSPIEKAIRESELNLNPTNEGDKIRIKLPELTAERREELARLAHKIGEEARVRVRQIREELWREVQEQERSGQITEDEKFELKDKLQKTVDEYNDQIKELVEKKEEEIKTI